jgi:dTMP kinase
VFVTFEGVEGSGKSLQIARVEAYLAGRGVPCVRTREPGGTEFGKAVRHVLLDRHGAAREPLSELLLYLADRHQHLKQVVEPALARGLLVLSDRYHDATRAYQGAARGIPASTLRELERIVGIPDPDCTVLLDLDPEVGLTRARRRNAADAALGDQGRFEAETLDFHRAVRAAYLALAEGEPARFRVVPAEGTPDEVFARIEPLIAAWLPREPLAPTDTR